MAINFPASPSVNDTFTVGSITYQCVQNNPTKWIGLGVTPADRLVEGSNSLEITAGNDLIWTGDRVGLNTSSPEAKLEVRDTGAQGVIIRSENTQSTNTNKALRIRNNSADNTFWVSHKGFTQITINDDTDYSRNTTNTSNTTNTVLTLSNQNGTDGTGANNYVGINFSVANGATSTAQLNYVRIGDNSGKFEFKARNTANSYPNIMTLRSEGQVLIGTDIQNSFNGVGQSHNLIVVGESSDTDITDNSSAAITISNRDGTAFNTAGLHFAREDNDGNPHYCGASIVAQFKETQVTGQYPKADLVFLTSLAANNAPSEKMRIHADGNIEVVSGSVLGKFYASNVATLGLTDWTASVGWRVLEVFGKSNPNNLGSNYMDPIHVYLYHGYGWNGSALTSYLYLADQAPLARTKFPSGSGGSANELTIEWFDGTTSVSGATGVPAGSGSYYPRLTTQQMGSASQFQVRVIRRF